MVGGIGVSSSVRVREGAGKVTKGGVKARA